MGSKISHPPKAKALPRPGETIDGRYRLKDVVASGGMGVIMKAEQVRTGRDVAVKLLHPHIGAQADFAARFMREARVATLFDHPHIVRVYDVGETQEGALYLVMELLEGVELKDIITTSGPLPARDVIDIGLQMLDGLAEAHSHDVIHRDFKPSNIFVGKNRRGEHEVKLLDFGIAKLLDSQEMQLTATGNFTGTPAYVAPETMLTTPQDDWLNRKAADVYSAGLVLLEMAIGKRALDGGSVAQTLLLHLQQPILIPEALAHTPLGEVIRRATMKHPDDRYPDGDAMYRALRDAQPHTTPELCLSSEQIPERSSVISAELLQPFGAPTPEEGLEYLRTVPQHEIYRPPGQSVPVDDLDAGPTVISREPSPALKNAGSQTSPTAPSQAAKTVRQDAIVAPAASAPKTVRQEAIVAPAAPAQPGSTKTPPQDATQRLGMLPPMINPAPTSQAPAPSSGTDRRKNTKERNTGVAVALIGVLFAGAAIVLWLNETAPTAASPGPEAPPQVEEQSLAALGSEEEALNEEAPLEEEEPASIEVELRSDPVGAEVYDGETLLGRTELNLTLLEDDLPLEVRLIKEGFEEFMVEVDGSTLLFEASLVPVAKAPAAKSTRPSTAKKPDNSRRPQRVPTAPVKVTSPPPKPAAAPKEPEKKQEQTDPSIERLIDDLLPLE